MIALEGETKFKLTQYGKEITFFRQLIIEGQWEDAENFLNPLKIRQNFNYDRAIFELKRQQFLEDIEGCFSDELDLVGLLSRANDLQDKCTKEEFNSLCSYLTLPNLRDHPDFKDWSIEKGRVKCFDNILKLLRTIYPIESHESRIKDNRLFELFKQAIKFQCIVKGSSEIENITLLQDSFTEEEEKEVFQHLWGGHKFNIKEERNVQRDIDLSESFSSLYFGSHRDQEAQKRPVTAQSSVFTESFRPKRITKLDVQKKQAPEKIVQNKTYEEKIPKDPIEKEDTFQFVEPERKQVTEEAKPIVKAEEYYEEVKDDKAQHIDISKLTQRSMITDKQPIRTCCFSPEGELLAIGTNSMTLIICSVKEIVYSLDDKYKSQLGGPLELPVVLEQRKYHNGSIYSVDWSHTGRLIASGSNDRTINLLISPFSDPSNADKVNLYHIIE
jgi:WD40 repeat protein